MGKGSKPRPMSIDRTQYSSNWDAIFMNQHKRGLITEQISTHMSENGKKEAIVIKTEKGYMVELYNKSKYIRTVDVSDKSLFYAEDTAENYVLGVLPE